MRSFIHGVGLLLVIALTAWGQSFPRLTEFPLFPGNAPPQVAALDDVDGDGVPDVAILNCSALPPSPGVYSGATGAQLTALGTPGSPTVCHAIIGCGDWDGDGLEDVAIQTANPPQVLVCSSASGLQIAALATGVTDVPRLDVLEDIDGDGRPELVVPSAVIFGAAILSTLTGAELYQFPARSFTHRPLAIAVDDRDQDGLDDVLVVGTIPGTPPSHSGIIYSSVSGIPIQTLSLPLFGLYLHDLHQVVRLGDLNGDTVDEIAVVQLDVSDGRIVIFDGTGPQLESIEFQRRSSTQGIYVGDHVAALGDVNGDDTDDFLVIDFAGVTDPSRLEMSVYSGADMCPMSVVGSDILAGGSYARFRDIGDTNGDGLDDVLIALTVPGTGVPYSEIRVTIEAFSGRGLYGNGSTLTADWISGPASQRLDGQFELRGGTSNGTAVIIVSGSAANVPLGPFDLSVDLTPGTFLAVNIPMDGLGELNLPLDLDLPIVAGIPVYLQAFEQTATGLEASNGLGIRFGSSGNESPQVLSVSPPWLLPGATLDPMTSITGDCFTAGVRVALNGLPLSVAATADPDVIDVSATPAPVVPPDSLLTVSNPGGGTATFVYNPSPVIDVLEVPGAPTDELATIGGDLVNLHGRHFFPGSVLTVDGVTIVPSTLEETLIVFESLPLAAGTASVVVTSPNGGVATFSAAVVQRSPVILSVEPLSAVAGDVVTIRGEFFAAGLSVTIGGQSLVPTVDNTPGLPPGVAVTVPAGLGCAEALVVANPDGSSDSATFNPLPVVTSYTSTVVAGLPAVISVDGPLETLVGASVTVDGVAIANVNPTPTGFVFFTIPLPAGTFDLVITSVAGCSLTLPLTYQ